MSILLDINLSPGQRNWVVLLVALLAVYLLFRPKLKKKKDPLEQQPVFSGLAQQRTVERQMQNLLVELSEMARQISAQLDTRAAKLEALIEEADRKLEELRGATGGSSASQNFSMPMVEESRSAQFPSPPATASAAPAAPAPAALPVDPRHAEVYALADSGRPASEIASQLGRSSGEVELILALRPRG